MEQGALGAKKKGHFLLLFWGLSAALSQSIYLLRISNRKCSWASRKTHLPNSLKMPTLWNQCPFPVNCFLYFVTVFNAKLISIQGTKILSAMSSWLVHYPAFCGTDFTMYSCFLPSGFFHFPGTKLENL